MTIRMLFSRITAVALSLCLSCTGISLTQETFDDTTIMASATSQEVSGTCGENVTWSLDESTGVLTISGTGDMANYNDRSIFYNLQERFDVIVIEDGVTSIGDNAFKNDRRLKSITIPDSVTYIGESAFEWCDSLTSITIPDSVERIGGGAFFGCNEIREVHISDLNSWCEIDFASFTATPFAYPVDNLYLNDKLISDLVIPDNITIIKDYTFAGFRCLTSITIPKNVTSIGEGAFRECSKLSSITIPDNVTFIGDSAFSHCDSLTSITIPDSVTTIGDAAFFSCDSLTSITIPDGVTFIGDTAFSFCDRLTNIDVSPDNRNYSSTDGVLFNKDKSILECYPRGKKENYYIIPDNVALIGTCAFYDCVNLTAITIPNSVNSIGCFHNFLNYCENITDVYYAGSEDDWNKISGQGISDLSVINATIHYNSTGPSDAPETYYECFPKPYKIIALQSKVNGRYLGCDVGAHKSNGKYDMNDSVIKAEADKIQAYEEFELVPCSDGHYALRSRFNRKYLSFRSVSYRGFQGLKFRADFIEDTELLEMATDGDVCRFRFVNEDVYLCVTDDGNVTVSDELKGCWFKMVTVSENNYTSDEKKELASNQWFNLDNKGVGYWNIQNEIGQKKSNLISLRNTDSMYALGYTMLSRKDRFAATIEYDNMQCAVGAKKLSNGTFDVLIVFQGTDGYSDEDVFNSFRDIGSNLTSEVNEKSMHNGYAEMAKKLIDHEDDIVVNPYLEAINKIDSKYTLSDFLDMAKTHKAKITLLGHSMGGAIAQCYAIHLADDWGIDKTDIKGRTFNPALAVAYDVSWPDWINLCVSSDTVPNGLVPGSIYEYGVHRLGETIWLYDPEPDINNDECFPGTNIADSKHSMNQSIYNLLSGITENNSAYYNNLINELRKSRTTENNLYRPIYLEISENDKVMVSGFKDMMLSVTDGVIQKIDESIKAVIENDKLYIELPTDKEYTIEVTSTDDRPSMVAVSKNTTKYGTDSISIYEVPESNSTFTVNIPANHGNAILTDTNGEAVEPVKKWILGDVNNDGTLTLEDVEILQKWLMADLYTSFSDWTTADINRDGKLNACDLSLLKRIILEG